MCKTEQIIWVEDLDFRDIQQQTNWRRRSIFAAVRQSFGAGSVFLAISSRRQLIQPSNKNLKEGMKCFVLTGPRRGEHQDRHILCHQKTLQAGVEGCQKSGLEQ